MNVQALKQLGKHVDKVYGVELDELVPVPAEATAKPAA